MARAAVALLLAAAAAEAVTVEPLERGEAAGAAAIEPLESSEALELEERPRGARRRARERAQLQRDMAAFKDALETTPPPKPVFCPDATVDSPAAVPLCEAQAVLALQQAFYSNFSRQVASAFESAFIGTYLTVGDSRGSSFFGNWLANAKILTDANRNSHMHVVHVALDQGAVTACHNLRDALDAASHLSLDCVSLAGWLPAQVFEGDRRDGTCESNLVLWTKPHILKAAIASSPHPVLLIDTEVIVHQDLLSLASNLLLKSEGHKQMVAGQDLKGLANTATVFATKVSLPLLLQWAEQAGKCLHGREADQGALQHVLSAYTQSTLEHFDIGDVGQCAKKGRFATHYSCMSRKHVGEAMKGNRDWVVTIPTDPKDLMKPGQLISLKPKDLIKNLLG